MPVDPLGPSIRAINRMAATNREQDRYKNTLAQQGVENKRQNELMGMKRDQFNFASDARTMNNKIKEMQFAGKIFQSIEDAPASEREMAYQWGKDEIEKIFGPNESAPERYDQAWVKNMARTTQKAEQKLYETTEGYQPRNVAIGLSKPGAAPAVEMQTIYGPGGKTKRIPITKGQEFSPEAGWTLSRPGQTMELETTPEGGVRFTQGAGKGKARRAPTGYRWMEGGEKLEAIPGGPASRPTKQQGEAKLYSTRAATSDEIMTDLEGKYSREGLAVKKGMEGVPLAGSIANYLLPEEAQQVEQAQRNFINAILRRESGAVINPEEFINADKQYFPQAGDKPKVIEQKRQNRKEAIDNIAAMAMPEAQPEDTPPITGARKAPDGNWYVQKEDGYYLVK